MRSEMARGDDRVVSELSAFWREAIHCRACPTIAPHRKFPPASHGTARYRLMLIGEAPGRVSLENGRPFSNPRNLTIRSAFARAVAPRAWELEAVFYLTDVVKCWPASVNKANRSPAANEIRTCVERHLKRELDLVRPRLVLAFGALASSAALGYRVRLASVHGRPQVTETGMRVIPLLHPSTANMRSLKQAGILSIEDYERGFSKILRSELRRLVPLIERDF